LGPIKSSHHRSNQREKGRGTLRKKKHKARKDAKTTTGRNRYKIIEVDGKKKKSNY